MKKFKKMAENWVEISPFGKIWKPKTKGESLVVKVLAFHWQKKSAKELAETANKKQTHFPLCECVEVQSGEVYSIRTDFASLRQLEEVPKGATTKIVYGGKKKLGGKRKPMQLFQVFVAPSTKRVNRFSEENPMPHGGGKTK